MRSVSITAAALLLAACSHGSANSSSAPETASSPAPAAANEPAGTAQGASAARAEEDPASEEVRDHHRHHHQGGVTWLVALSLDTLDADPQKQTQVQQIQSSLREQMTPARDAERNLLSALADGVASGNVSQPRVSSSLDNLEAATILVHEKSLDTINQLHALLSPEERQAVAEKVRAHWEVWRKVNADEDYGSKEMDSHLTRMAEALQMTPDQVDRISAQLKSNAPPKPDPAASQDRMEAFATAFASDKFDARTLGANDAQRGRFAHSGAARMVRFYEIATPVLTPDQRSKLADHLRDRANDARPAVSMN
jgi:Spy/CpxP family protein refolding chaperone